MSTLYKLLQKKDQCGFVLALGYYVELNHDVTGMFPAIESETREMVMTVDINLLKRVCGKLPPRQFKLGIQLLYVNPKTGIAYSIFGPDKRSLERATPFQSLTASRLRRLSQRKNPFKWCMHIPNGSSREISPKMFKAAVNKLSASRFPAG